MNQSLTLITDRTWPDLHLLLNTLTSPALRQSETWLPICLPKFNAEGFVHAYISYVMEDVALVFVGADRDGFEGLRAWKGIVLEVSQWFLAFCF